MACECLQLQYTLSGGTSTSVTLTFGGTFNGYNYWEFTDGIVTYSIWHDSGNPGFWHVSTDGVGGIALTGCTIKDNNDQCPYYSIPVWTPNGTFDEFTTSQCPDNPCGCLEIIIDAESLPSKTIISTANNTQYNMRNTFEFVFNGVTCFIWYSGTRWFITDGIGSLNIIYFRNANGLCPNASLISVDGWVDGGVFADVLHFSTQGVLCQNPCPCLKFTWQNWNDFSNTSVEATTTAGTFNGASYWEITHGATGNCFYIYLYKNEQGCCQWHVNYSECNALAPDVGLNIATLGVLSCDAPCGVCPVGIFTMRKEATNIIRSFEVTDCDACIYLEDRIEKQYGAIKFPVVFEEQNRGWLFSCCETFLVLADPTDSVSWKNDVNSAWIKLSDPTDTVAFRLYKDGVLTAYQPTPTPFVNEIDAYYATIQWLDVLNSDGIGCYTWKIEYNISGVIGTFIWGVYNLKQYSIDNAQHTARIRVKLNLVQAIESINFTDSNVEDSIRFYGFIGERQPNMEIDNLIYQNREVKTVIRQNLNEYTITTDPALEDVTIKLCDLYLLSENEMFISDYNSSNHSYRYLDLPVIVQNTPEINYIDIHQRRAIVTCIVGDKTKNKRTFY